MSKELENYVNDKLSNELNVIRSSNRSLYEKNLTNYEKAVIYKYSNDGFEQLNEDLREGKANPQLGVFLDICLEKLPDYEGICYRAIKCSKSSLERYYTAFEKGLLVHEKTFLSCSKSKLLALYFSESPLFIILSKSGKSIENIAKFGIESGGQNEQEILFRLNSKFKVLDITEQDNKIIIKLEQV